MAPGINKKIGSTIPRGGTKIFMAPQQYYFNYFLSCLIIGICEAEIVLLVLEFRVIILSKSPSYCQFFNFLLRRAWSFEFLEYWSACFIDAFGVSFLVYRVSCNININVFRDRSIVEMWLYVDFTFFVSKVWQSIRQPIVAASPWLRDWIIGQLLICWHGNSISWKWVSEKAGLQTTFLRMLRGWHLGYHTDWQIGNNATLFLLIPWSTWIHQWKRREQHN